MPRPITKVHRAERREAAEARLLVREARSPVEQLTLLKKRPGKAQKEARRLRKQLDRAQRR